MDTSKSTKKPPFQGTLIIGPDHGEIPFTNLEKPSVTYIPLGYLDNEEISKGYINIQKLRDLLEKHPHQLSEDLEELSWGSFTLVEFDFQDQEYFDAFLHHIVEEITNIFIFAGTEGDDFVFDYMPSYIQSLERILEYFDRPDLVRKATLDCIALANDPHDHRLETFPQNLIEEYFNKG